MSQRVQVLFAHLSQMCSLSPKLEKWESLAPFIPSQGLCSHPELHHEVLREVPIYK